MQAPKVIRLAQSDNVTVAVTHVLAGDQIEGDVAVASSIPPGHKIAMVPIPAGAAVMKYGQVIGIATADISPGEHVHSHNLSATDMRAMPHLDAYSARPDLRLDVNVCFDGYRRASGRAGTRNYVGIMASVNCSATVVHAIADRAKHLLLPKYSYVDGIAQIAHQSGCGMARSDPGFEILNRTMHGFLNHPNFGGVLVVGLGCEVTGSAELVPQNADVHRYRRFDIQQAGGTTAAIELGLRQVEELMAIANCDRRELIPISGLVVGLQCGGSDGLSGVTANPAMGMAVDQLIACGGTALLSETPEIFGAEHLLLSRARSPQVAEALRAKIDWWLDYANRNGVEIDNNPSPGNRQGGLTTIFEKSLGAVAKGGQSRLEDVIDYAQLVCTPGLVFMDSPGFDPCSATGQIASGANLLLFSTGRGSCFGCKPAPSVKLATNSDLYRRMTEDMDIDCGRILEGTPMSTVSAEIFQTMLAVASGRKSKSERLGYGDHEFVPWRLGAVL